MTPQAEILSSVTPRKIENGWGISMPKEIADAFGLPEGSIVILYAQPGNVSAQMNLTAQTNEAKQREPGWFIEMPPAMAMEVGVAEGSIIGIYSKMGNPYVEIMTPPPPDLEASALRIFEKYKGAFEELKRLGD